MKKVLYTLMMVGSLTLLGQGVSADIGVGAPDTSITGPRGGSVLFSTFSGIAPVANTVTSQEFTDFPGTSTVSADDFVIPGSVVQWTIETVRVEGTYFNLSPGGGPTGPATSVNVYILGNSGTLPDTTNLSAGSIYAAEGIAYVDLGFGDFEIALPGVGATLPPGTYWLVVQAVMSFAAGGQWGWTESSLMPDTGMSIGFESAFFETVAVINGNCLNMWGARITTCMVTSASNPPPEPDFAFELVGQAFTAGVSVNPTAGLITTEAGGMDSFTVVLDAPPSMDVDVPIMTTDASETLVEETTRGGPTASLTLTFTSLDWDQPKTVTVTGQDDDVDDGDIVHMIQVQPSISMDMNFNGLDGPDVEVTNQDDDTVGVIVMPTSGLITTELGGTDSYTVVLNSEPTADVMIPVSSSDPTEGLPDTAMLTFTSANWDTPQTVTVTGQNDAIQDGDVAYTLINGDPASSDPLYNALVDADAADVGATNQDDGDTAGFLVIPTSGLVTTEAGGTDTFTVELTAQPTADVMLPITSDDPTEGLPDVMGLTFTDMDWNIPQTVTVTGQDDPDFDGDVIYNLVTGDPTSADPIYNALTAAQVDDVEAININDELCAPVSIQVTIDGPIIVTGLPGCVFDLYNTFCVDDTLQWVLIASGIVIPASGQVTVPGVLGEPDSCYVATSTGNIDDPLNPFVRTVPTLNTWGLVLIIAGLAVAALVLARRRRIA